MDSKVVNRSALPLFGANPAQALRYAQEAAAAGKRWIDGQGGQLVDARDYAEGLHAPCMGHRPEISPVSDAGKCFTVAAAGDAPDAGA